MARRKRGGNSSFLSREERNLREKERRMRVKHLLSILSALVSPRKHLQNPQLIEQATLHMIQLKERVRGLKERKEMLLGGVDNHFEGASSSGSSPILYINSHESTVEVNLISSLNTKNFMLYEIINVLEEEGAEPTSVNLHNTRDRTTYTIIGQAMVSRIGFETWKIEQRLRGIIF